MKVAAAAAVGVVDAIAKSAVNVRLARRVPLDHSRPMSPRPLSQVHRPTTPTKRNRRKARRSRPMAKRPWTRMASRAAAAAAVAAVAVATAARAKTATVPRQGVSPALRRG